MAKRDLVEKAVDYAYRRLVVPTADRATQDVRNIAEVVKRNPEEYARTVEEYLRRELRFWWAVLIALGVIIVGGSGCFVYVAAFGGNDAVKFGGLAAGLTGLLGVLTGIPWEKVKERRLALADVMGYNIRFLSSIQNCNGDLNCISACVKEYQDWVRTL